MCLSSRAADENTKDANKDLEATNESAEKTVPVARPAQPTHLIEREQDILTLVGSSEVVWLPSEAAENRTLALWQPAMNGRPKGAVLMIHNGGTDVLSPDLFAPLRQYLAEHGWATLVVTAPALPRAPIPPRAPMATPSPDKPDAPPAMDETASPDQPAAPEEMIAASEPDNPPMAKVPPRNYADLQSEAVATLQSGLAYLHQKGQYNVALLGEGLGAEWIWAFANALSGNPNGGAVIRSGKESARVSSLARAVIIINAHQALIHEFQTKKEAEDSLPTMANFPTLDIYVDDYELAIDAADVRQNRAKMMKLPVYQQKRFGMLKPKEATKENSALNKRIRGFLDKHAAGVQMK